MPGTCSAWRVFGKDQPIRRRTIDRQYMKMGRTIDRWFANTHLKFLIPFKSSRFHIWFCDGTRDATIFGGPAGKTKECSFLFIRFQVGLVFESGSSNQLSLFRHCCWSYLTS